MRTDGGNWRKKRIEGGAKLISQESLNRIDSLIEEGQRAIDKKEVRRKAVNNLEGEIQTHYFALIRKGMVSRTAHLAMSVGSNESANKQFAELMRR